MTEQPPHTHDEDAADDVLVDGYSLEQLSDYLDRDRTPVDPEIEDSPACRRALARIERLRAVSDEILREDADHRPVADESWFQSILTGLSREVRAGRSVPIPHPEPSVDLSITEGAIRSLIRRAGDSVPGVVIGHTELDGHISEPGEPVIVNLALTAFARSSLADLADRVRNAVAAALEAHTRLSVAEINVTVTDIRVGGHEGGHHDR